MLMALRNDPDAVRFSVTGRAVTSEEHERWFRTVRSDPSRCRIWIAEDGSTPVGQLRVDLDGDSGTVSIAVAADHRGRGIGTAMLRALVIKAGAEGAPVAADGGGAFRQRSLAARLCRGRLPARRRGQRVPGARVAVTVDAPSTREYWASQVREHHDAEGRIFRYVAVKHPGARGLVVHFSAFFGEWGDAPQHRKIFQGHFHRLRMLATHPTTTSCSSATSSAPTAMARTTPARAATRSWNGRCSI